MVQRRRSKRIKSKTENGKFDQSDRESVDSGRMSRRGDADNIDIESDDDDSSSNKDVLSPNKDMFSSYEDDGRQSSGSTACRKVKGRGIMASAISEGKTSPAEWREGGDLRGIDSVSVSYNTVGLCLAVDSGYTDRSYSSTPEGAGASTFTGRSDVDEDPQEDEWVEAQTPGSRSGYGYRSMPASRQDGECLEHSGREGLGQVRGCQSARVTRPAKDDRKQCLITQSQSSPLLATTEIHTDCNEQMRKHGNEADSEAVHNSCAANGSCDNGAPEGDFPGRPRHINDALASSTAHTGSGDVTCRRKSVTWEDTTEKTNKRSSGSEDILGCYVPLNTSDDVRERKGSDSLKLVSSLDNMEDDSPAKSNNSPVTEHLASIVYLIAQFKAQLDSCASGEVFLHEDKFDVYRSGFEEIAQLMQECKDDPQKVSPNLLIIREYLLSLQSAMAPGLCVDEDGTTAKDKGK